MFSLEATFSLDWDLVLAPSPDLVLVRDFVGDFTEVSDPFETAVPLTGVNTGLHGDAMFELLPGVRPERVIIWQVGLGVLV